MANRVQPFTLILGSSPQRAAYRLAVGCVLIVLAMHPAELKLFASFTPHPAQAMVVTQPQGWQWMRRETLTEPRRLLSN